MNIESRFYSLYCFFRKFIPQKKEFQFKTGDFVRFPHYIPFMVDDHFGLMLYPGGKIFSDGEIREGRRAYKIDCDPDGNILKIDPQAYEKEIYRRPIILVFEDALIKCTREEYDRLEVDLKTERVFIKPNQPNNEQNNP